MTKDELRAYMRDIIKRIGLSESAHAQIVEDIATRCAIRTV